MRQQSLNALDGLAGLPGLVGIDAQVHLAADALACAICHAHGARGFGGLCESGYRVRAGRLI